MKAGMYGDEFAKGRRAAKAGKSRFDCPYNGPDLRDGWLAGFDSVRRY
jgi:ribosome modulation factor